MGMCVYILTHIAVLAVMVGVIAILAYYSHGRVGVYYIYLHRNVQGLIIA